MQSLKSSKVQGMNNSIDKNENLKWGLAIKILSVVSLGFLALYYFILIGVYKVSAIYLITYDISVLIELAIYILFAIYVFVFYNKQKGAILFPIVFGLIAFYNLYGFIYNALNSPYAIGYYLPTAIIAVAYILVTIISLKGFPSIKITVILILLGICADVFAFLLMPGIFENILCTISRIVLYVALLLLVLKCQIPAIISTPIKNNHSNTISTQQALKSLQDKFISGTITEEEYKKQRADIISKL